MTSVPNNTDLFNWISQNNRLPVLNPNDDPNSLENLMFEHMRILRDHEREILERNKKLEEPTDDIDELFEWVKNHNGMRPRINSEDLEEVKFHLTFISLHGKDVPKYRKAKYDSKFKELSLIQSINFCNVNYRNPQQ